MKTFISLYFALFTEILSDIYFYFILLLFQLNQSRIHVTIHITIHKNITIIVTLNRIWHASRYIIDSFKVITTSKINSVHGIQQFRHVKRYIFIFSINVCFIKFGQTGLKRSSQQQLQMYMRSVMLYLIKALVQSIYIHILNNMIVIKI